MTTQTAKLPEELTAAYEWTRAAGELAELAGLSEGVAAQYAKASAENSASEGDGDVTAGDVMVLREWLRNH